MTDREREARIRDRGTTHWEGCWRSHPRCAEARKEAEMSEREVLDRERWRPIPGCDYEASSMGRIRNAETGYVLKSHSNSRGYLILHLYRSPGDAVTARVHRLVLLAFEGECPDGHEADHINRNPADNRIANLRWLPSEENLPAHGEEHYKAKLTRSDVVELRRRSIGSRESFDDMASEYGVAPETVRDAVTGESWSHLDDPPPVDKKRCLPASKLTDDDVRQIRNAYETESVTQRELAERFGVCKSTIGRVVRRDGYTHVT